MKSAKAICTLIALAMIQTSASAQKQKVCITVPSDVKIRVCPDFKPDRDSLKITPQDSSSASGKKTYTYFLESGPYSYMSSGDGYYRLAGNFVVGNRAMKLDADPGRRHGNGYETKFAWKMTEGTNKALSTDVLSKRYPKVLTVPAFSKKKGSQEYTSQEELEAFITTLDDPKDNLYTYSIGLSYEGKNIPFIVATTDNIAGMTMEEAAEVIRKDGKPTVMLHAMIHGNEPSATDGALATVAELDGAYGKAWLPKVNVLIIPRVNCDGARNWTRGTKGFHDLNRDNMLVRQPETRAAHKVYNLFLPEVVLDMHEYGITGTYMSKVGFLDDAGITISGNGNNTPALNGIMAEMMRYTESRGAEDGLRYWEYVQTGYSDQSPLHASHYYALRGSANFLVEAPSATGDKNTAYPRRVFTQFYTAKSLIEFAAANAERLCNIVAADRKSTAEAGAKFDTTDKLILKYGQNKESYSYQRRKFNLEDGSVIKDTTVSLRYYEVPMISRPRPTAYIIPKSAEHISEILETASYNGISYYEAGSGEAMELRQYEGDGKEASLKDEALYAFAEGAYVFPMSQPSGIVLGLLMEPDTRMTDPNPITLLQAGLVKIDEIYRCEKNLAEGRVPTVKLKMVK